MVIGVDVYKVKFIKNFFLKGFGWILKLRDMLLNNFSSIELLVVLIVTS